MILPDKLVKKVWSVSGAYRRFTELNPPKTVKQYGNRLSKLT